MNETLADHLKQTAIAQAKALREQCCPKYVVWNRRDNLAIPARNALFELRECYERADECERDMKEFRNRLMACGVFLELEVRQAVDQQADRALAAAVRGPMNNCD
jgi:hypothetical protein